MTRLAQFAIIAAGMAAISRDLSGAPTRTICDMTPAGVTGSPALGYLVAANDAGPWVPLPPYGKIGFLQAMVDAGATGAVTVVAEVTNDQAAPPVVIWTSQTITGATTSDGFIPQCGACWIRLRRTDSLGVGNVSGTLVWS